MFARNPAKIISKAMKRFAASVLFCTPDEIETESLKTPCAFVTHICSLTQF